MQNPTIYILKTVKIIKKINKDKNFTTIIILKTLKIFLLSNSYRFLKCFYFIIKLQSKNYM